MDAATLKNLQAPLKEKYHAQPQSAVITLKAEGKIGEDISCNVETGRALTKAGLHPATGLRECLLQFHGIKNFYRYVFEMSSAVDRGLKRI